MSEEQNSPEGEQGTETFTKADVEAMIAEATEGLKGNRDTLLKEKKEAQKRADEAEKARKEMERKALEAEGDPEKIRAAVRSEYEENLQTLQQERDQLRQQYEAREYESQLRDAANNLPIAPEGLDALATYLQNKHEVVIQDGQVTIDGHAPGKFLERFIEGDKGSFWRRGKQNTGGGAETPDQRPEGGGKKLSEMTPEQKAHLFTHDKAKYWQLRDAENKA